MHPRGLSGESEFWDHCLESFTLMAAVLTLPPAIAARMASTIDSVAPGRFGINIVSGWQQAEYSQMGLWPSKEHFDRRYVRGQERGGPWTRRADQNGELTARSCPAPADAD